MTGAAEAAARQLAPPDLDVSKQHGQVPDGVLHVHGTTDGGAELSANLAEPPADVDDRGDGHGGQGEVPGRGPAPAPKGMTGRSMSKGGGARPPAGATSRAGACSGRRGRNGDGERGARQGEDGGRGGGGWNWVGVGREQFAPGGEWDSGQWARGARAVESGRGRAGARGHDDATAPVLRARALRATSYARAL